MGLKPSKLSLKQALKVTKVAAFLFISAGIGALLAQIANNPTVFGVATPVVNLVLVLLQQVFTPAEQ